MKIALAIISMLVLVVTGWLFFTMGEESPAKEPHAPPKNIEPDKKQKKPVSKTTTRPRSQSIDLASVAAQRERLQPDETERQIAEELAEERRWLSSSLPRKIHFAASHCYHGQGEGKERIKIKYDLHVADSQASVSNIEFVEDPLEDVQFRGCVRTAMESFTMSAASVPDMEESDDMILSIRGLKKILRQQATDRE